MSVVQKKLKIVVPTNFSRKSEQALDFALEYSRNGFADVYLFHVFQVKDKRDYSKIDRLNVEYMDRMKESVIQAIDRLAQRGIQHSVEGVHRRISNGKMSDEVLEIASGISADMIVMGAPSDREFKDLVFKAPCSLVLVKEKDI
jgi:nucleotide-binding universal stress UspA family protein